MLCEVVLYGTPAGDWWAEGESRGQGFESSGGVLSVGLPGAGCVLQWLNLLVNYSVYLPLLPRLGDHSLSFCLKPKSGD